MKETEQDAKKLHYVLQIEVPIGVEAFYQAEEALEEFCRNLRTGGNKKKINTSICAKFSVALRSKSTFIEDVTARNKENAKRAALYALQQRRNILTSENVSYTDIKEVSESVAGKQFLVSGEITIDSTEEVVAKLKDEAIRLALKQTRARYNKFGIPDDSWDVVSVEIMKWKDFFLSKWFD